MYQSKLNFSLPKSGSRSVESNSKNTKSIVERAPTDLSSSIDQNSYNYENYEESSTYNNLSEFDSQIFNGPQTSNLNFSTPKSLAIPNQPVTVKKIRKKENRCFQTTWYKSFK
ncbi:unnamed protein product [Brachionus calyciflorus]|uniref:Uncharacterized protein n=1 Tax=Brachionus calyciflorus TaxID=104777 RepID=A0A814FYS1_9BILA|nr:unnamed protein product [Brachionus calyciflorus]